MPGLSGKERDALRQLQYYRGVVLLSCAGLILIPTGLYVLTHSEWTAVIGVFFMLIIALLVFMKYAHFECPNCGKSFFGESRWRMTFAADIGESWGTLHCFSCGLSTRSLKTNLKEILSADEVSRRNINKVRKSIVSDIILFIVFGIIVVLFVLKSKWAEAVIFGLVGIFRFVNRLRTKLAYLKVYAN